MIVCSHLRRTRRQTKSYNCTAESYIAHLCCIPAPVLWAFHAHPIPAIASVFTGTSLKLRTCMLINGAFVAETADRPGGVNSLVKTENIFLFLYHSKNIYERIVNGRVGKYRNRRTIKVKFVSVTFYSNFNRFNLYWTNLCQTTFKRV